MMNMINMMNTIKLNLNKLYYKYIDTSIVNHYRLLIITEEYIQISKNYFSKYPNAKNWINLNKELFEKNKKAELDYIESSKKQNELQKLFFENREIICKSSNVSKDCIICSEDIKSFYVDKNYHYGQSAENLIFDIIKDIQNIENNK